MKLFLKKNCEESELIERMLTFFQIEADVKYFEGEKALQKGSMANLAPLKKFPVLCQDSTCLNDLQSIIKYLCSLQEETLIGKTVLDQCCLDQYCTLLMNLQTQCKSHENLKENKEQQDEVVKSLNEQWQMIENRLLYNAFLAGNYMTYADIILVLTMKQFDFQGKLLRRNTHQNKYKHRNLLTVLKHFKNTQSGRRKLWKDNAVVGFFVDNTHRKNLTKQIIDASEKLEREKQRADQQQGYFKSDFDSYKLFVNEKVDLLTNILDRVGQSVEKVILDNINHDKQ